VRDVFQIHWLLRRSSRRTASAFSSSDKGSVAINSRALAKSPSLGSAVVTGAAFDRLRRGFSVSLVQPLVQRAFSGVATFDRFPLGTLCSCVRNAEVEGSNPFRSTGTALLANTAGEAFSLRIVTFSSATRPFWRFYQPLDRLQNFDALRVHRGDHSVISAQAGIQKADGRQRFKKEGTHRSTLARGGSRSGCWVPACAGMTVTGSIHRGLANWDSSLQSIAASTRGSTSSGAFHG
jgi:hypothetical protein